MFQVYWEASGDGNSREQAGKESTEGEMTGIELMWKPTAIGTPSSVALVLVRTPTNGDYRA